MHYSGQELVFHSVSAKSHNSGRDGNEKSLFEVLSEATGKSAVKTEEIPSATAFETFEAGKPLTIAGKYMSITLCRCLVNLNIVASFTGERKKVTLIQVIFHNLCSYPLSSTKVNMIDSEGFQHEGSYYNGIREIQTAYGSEPVPISFPYPADKIEDSAKTKGWICFEDPLEEQALPQRLIFTLPLFKPGDTSGWVIDEQVTEFFIKSCTTNAITRLI